MTPHLRSAAVRSATRYGIESACRRSASTSRTPFQAYQLCAPCARRFYSERPKSSKEPKDSSGAEKKQRDVNASKPSNSAQQFPSQPAPGTENLYSKHGPLSPSEASETSETPSTQTQISKEDQEMLDEMVEKFKPNMPKSLREDFEKALRLMSKSGIPDDFREIMNVWRGKKELDLASVAKLIRIVHRVTLKAAELNAESERDSAEKGQQKAGRHDPGPANKKQKNQQDESKGGWQSGGFGEFKIGGFRLDAGTFFTTAVVSYMTYRALVPGENSRDITWQEFRTQFFDRGLVQKLTVINRNRVKVHLDRDAAKAAYPDSPAGDGNFFYYFNIGDLGTFERHLDEAHQELGIPSSQRVPVTFAEMTPWLGLMLSSWLPTIILISGSLYLLRRGAGGAGSGGASGIFGMGRSRAKRFNHETDVKVAFKDVAGMDEAKLEIMEFVSFLKEPGMYHKLGAKIPRGAILSGPPGTGKTLLAKATAGESQVPFFSVSGSEFVEMFVGVGASRVRDLFQTARKNAPCIIFIDEIDAIGKSRGRGMGGGGNEEREATLNQILTEMDGFATSEQVVVLAGTNRQDVLDKALLRPGRFDRHISIDKPTMEGRKQIFAVHLKKIVTAENMENLQGRLAALTPGFAGADIANCVNEAALIAARNKAASVTMEHFEAAIDRVIGGLEKKSLVLNPEEKKVIAYHEAGHAICGWFFKYADPLLKVSIIPRGSAALGYAQYLPNSESYLMNVNQLMDRMAMTLGGRVSEEIHFESVTSGASDDFNKVTRMATAMVTKFGMSSKIGHLYFEDDPSQQLHKPFSEETAKNIDLEVRRIVEEAHRQCKDLLTAKKKEIGLVAEELLQKEMLQREDMIRILGPRPFDDTGDISKYFGSRGDREGVGEPKPGEANPESPGDGGPLGGGIGPQPTAYRH